ncbi:MAG: anti-sigma-F factor Fin family protein [Clostridia bacterium]|jgi:hypothetical protein|nr:anti-sigma-F factor Fin family protein [Clostridia bacterium]
MRFVYICAECENYIGELELANWDESMLGFDTLDSEEKKELVQIDFADQLGTVKAICDDCYKKKTASPFFYHQADDPGIH